MLAPGVAQVMTTQMGHVTIAPAGGSKMTSATGAHVVSSGGVMIWFSGRVGAPLPAPPPVEPVGSRLLTPDLTTISRSDTDC